MYMLASENGEILAREKVPTVKDAQLLYAGILRFLDAAGVQAQEVTAMGLGIPGCVSRARFVSDAPALCWKNVDLGALFDRFPFKSAAANDVTCALYAECEQGIGRHSDNLLFISIGTGLGSAFKADGRIVDGHAGMSGEIGYFAGIEEAKNTISFGGDVYGALESVVSGTGLTNSGKPFGLTAQNIFSAADSGNADAKRIIDDFLVRLAVATANCTSLLNPEYVVYGGGISNELPPYMDILRGTVARLTPTPVKLEITSLKTDAGALGAVALAKTLA